jgi:hypothetical protein
VGLGERLLVDGGVGLRIGRLAKLVLAVCALDATEETSLSRLCSSIEGKSGMPAYAQESGGEGMRG